MQKLPIYPFFLAVFSVSYVCGISTSIADTIRCETESSVFENNLFPRAKFETSAGDFVVELYRRKAPATVNNFLAYVDKRRYDGTIFHRVVADFVVQGGGYAPDLAAVESDGPICNEAGNGYSNRRGTIAMARHEDPHSATSQFYINLADNERGLDPRTATWGYAVFGEVVEGMEVLDAIGAVATGYDERLNSTEMPIDPVILKRITILPD